MSGDQSLRMLGTTSVTEPANNPEESIPSDSGLQVMCLTEEMLFALHGLSASLPVECDFCSKQFGDMDLFDAHMATHKECRFFSCQLCCNTYKSWTNLVAHRKACHQGEVLSCDTCGERKYHPDLGPVNFPVGSNPFGCEECGEGFTSVMQLYRHYRIHGTHQFVPTKDKLTKVLEEHKHTTYESLSEQSSDEKQAAKKPYKCGLCMKIFSGKKGMQEHSCSHQKKYHCTCGHEYTEWKDMSSHVLNNHKETTCTCPICNACSFSGEEFLKHYEEYHFTKQCNNKIKQASEFTCSLCSKIFSNPSALSRHQKLHNAVPPRHICELCGEEFKKCRELLKHVRQHYGDDLPEKYKKLEYKIKERNKRNKKAIIKKSFMCEYCGREFSKMLNLQLHVRRHTGDRPYSCQLCGKSFYTNQQLAIHVRFHTGERPYSCGVCRATFTGPNALYMHRKIHNKVKYHVCPHCDKKFFWKTSYTSHIRLHMGERPYQCTICSKSFTLRGKLNLHLKKHASEHAILACPDCGENFSSEGALKAHCDEQCCMTMVTYVEEGPDGEKDTKIIVMNTEDLEQNNIYLNNSEVVHLIVE